MFLYFLKLKRIRNIQIFPRPISKDTLWDFSDFISLSSLFEAKIYFKVDLHIILSIKVISLKLYIST